jgi:DNA-binding response OmpR family regulator
MKKIKILLVEDEATLAMIVKETLDSENFSVDIAVDGEDGLAKTKALKPDVLVVDIMMPKMDGYEMVRRIRQSDLQTPVLFLTARSSVDDVVEGFDVGGDDYLRKPFSMRELMVRIRALHQRAQLTKGIITKPDNNIIYIGAYTLNTNSQILSYRNNEEQLTHRETEILRMLSDKLNEVVTTYDILTQLWDDDSPCNAKSLQVFITKLRHHLEQDKSIRIINVRSIGYKLMLE